MLRKFVQRGSLLLLLSFGISACSSVMYFGRVQKTKLVDPAIVHLEPENIEIINSEGLRLHAWWFKTKTAKDKGSIVFFHGNAENLTSHFLSLSWIPDEGYNYLIWDYPGYGVSEGEPSPKSNALSAIAVMKWVHENKDQRPLIVLGQSMGGHIALRAALDLKDQIPMKAIIVDGAFLSNRSIGRQKLSEGWLTWLFQPLGWLLMNDSYAPDDPGRLAPIPLLVIRGDKDRVVAPRFGDEIFEKAHEPKQIWRIEEGQHIDTFWAHKKIYRQKLIEYLETLR